MSEGQGRVPLIAVGAHFPGTGFTRVLWSVLGGLAGRYDVHYIGIGYHGPRLVQAGVTLHPSNLRGGDAFGAYQCAEMVQSLNAPLVLLLNDLWMLSCYPHTLEPLRDRASIVAYTPIDGTLPDDSLLEPIAKFDRFVAYTEFGREQISQALASVAARGVETSGSTVSVVPHGVDTATFRPLAGRHPPDRPRTAGPGRRRSCRHA